MEGLGPNREESVRSQ